MKLLILYGPPAAGKYTIAKSLAETTGYKFFHNHASIDVVKPIIDFGAPGFFELSDKIRLDVFEEAAKQNIPGIVFTFVYRKKDDHKFVNDIVSSMAKYNAEVVFVQIHCDKEVLTQRVSSDQRKDMNKLTSSDELLALMDSDDFQSEIPNVNSHKIDNTNLTVEEAVEKISDIIR